MPKQMQSTPVRWGLFELEDEISSRWLKANPSHKIPEEAVGWLVRRAYQPSDFREIDGSVCMNLASTFASVYSDFPDEVLDVLTFAHKQLKKFNESKRGRAIKAVRLEGFQAALEQRPMTTKDAISRMARRGECVADAVKDAIREERGKRTVKKPL